jgi:hypothetical protein
MNNNSCRTGFASIFVAALMVRMAATAQAQGVSCSVAGAERQFSANLTKGKIQG